MEKITIKNRLGLDLLVQIEGEGEQLAFVTHGLGGYKEQSHIRSAVQAFIERGYCVVSFDTTNSIGESGGKMEDATLTTSYADLCDVIAWAKSQPWYRQPFALCGHSLGGSSVTLYAEDHPSDVAAIILMAPVVAGQLSLGFYRAQEPEEAAKWERTGWQISESKSRPGVMKRLPWSHMLDRLKYDLLPRADQLTMPTHIIVGERDESCPVEHQRLLLDRIPSKVKRFTILSGTDHNYRTPDRTGELKSAIISWLQTL